MVRKAGLHGKASIFGGCAVLRRAGLYGKARQAVVEDATIKTRDFAVCEGKPLGRVRSVAERPDYAVCAASSFSFCKSILPLPSIGIASI